MTVQTSDSIKALAAALCKVQAVVEGASKNAQNPHLKNRYADLSSVWDAIREPLTAQGLTITQALGTSEDGTMATCTTRIMHVSGEWLESTLALPVVKRDPQGFGSAYTYARRYSLMAVVGICPVDDDAEAAQGRRDAKPDAFVQPYIDRMRAAASVEECRAIGKQARVDGVGDQGLLALVTIMRERQEALHGAE
jgi:hypothetical protein